jgi:hypothetical protein
VFLPLMKMPISPSLPSMAPMALLALLARLAFLAILTAPLCATAETLEETPASIPISRYQAMIEKSPFAPATAAPAPTVEAPSFAKDYYITGMAQLGSKSFVTISSRDQQKRFSLVEGQTFEGMTLTGVEWAPGVGRSKVTLKKGSDFGVIGFDEAAMQPAAPPVQQAPQQVQNQPPGTGGRGSGNFGYGDRQRRRPGGEGWEERRRAWMEANRGQGGQGAQSGQQGQQGQQNGGAQWRRRPTTIPGG